MRTASLIAALAACALAAPKLQHLQARRLLGSSFGLPGKDATYDYVIVGGGTAGLALATRLAEQQTGTVAVIEAGGFYEIGNGNLSQVPATDSYYAGRAKNDWQPMIDWGYITSPQRGAYDTEMHYPRGKCLGGSSARHFLVYQRPTKSSLQRWADTVGDQSYSFDQFLPYFEKSVAFSPPNMHLRSANGTPEYDLSVMGSGQGPLSVTYPNYVQAFATWVTKGLEAIGIPIISGFQSGSLLGQSYTMFTLNATTMTRESSETSFLRRGLAYPNYLVYTSTMAKKIIFDDNKNAVGVSVDTMGTPYTLSAKREVIISSGAFGSPQLLMVSGVGPATALQELNIPVIADRPGVGRNMQDHVYFGASYPINAPTYSSLNDAGFAAEAARQYNEEHAGMYTDPTTDTIGWEKVPSPLRERLSNTTLAALATYPADWPELEYLSVAGYLGLQQNLATGDPHDGSQYASMAVGLITPRSRGNVTLASADTAVHPVINPNFLVDPADVEVTVAGFRRMREFWQSEAMAPLLVGEEAFPGKAVQTDAQIVDVLRKSFNTIYHAACTCAMGPANDSMAVVDAQSRVYGVQRLRVVDASALPFLTPGHPQSVVYALAEKMACAISGAC